MIIGGVISLDKQVADGETAASRRAIYIKGATGTVHIEGVLIEDPEGAEFDGVDIDAPNATVELEDLRIVGLRGGLNTFHANVVQPWGGVADLRVDRLTGSSNYQGLSLGEDLGPIGEAQLSNIDLTATTDPVVDGGGHMLWLTSGTDSCAGYPTTLENVFVQPRPGRSVANSVWPSADAGLTCDATGGSTATWPALPVAGSVQAGPPPGGSFVPESMVGAHYLSPGYETG